MMTAFLPRVQAALERRLRRASKRVYQSARWRNLEQPRVLFIVGCQRSGTTLMTQLFDADLGCRVFGEFSVLSSADSAGIRLNPLPEVERVIRRASAPLVVAKPLVETQNVRKLLAHFPTAKALFMYRSSYPNLILSDLLKFGSHNALDNIRPIAAGDPHNWRSEGASLEVCETVRRWFSPQMKPEDAAALFWWSRNRLYFDLDLPAEPRVMLCRYEALTRAPGDVMRGIYSFVDTPLPSTAATVRVHSRSAQRDKHVELHPAIAALCTELRTKLDSHYEWQSARDAVRPHLPGVIATSTFQHCK